MMSKFAPYLLSYTLSFATITTVLVYGLRLPTRITGNRDLVKTYYIDRFVSSTILDFFLIGLYLLAAMGLMRFLPAMAQHSLGWQIGTVALATILISGAFAWYFLSRPQTSQFFSRWFHAVGMKAVIYDIVLVSSVFVTTKWMLSHIAP